MERYISCFDCKGIDDKTGEFEGYGSTFGNIDEGNDVVEPGAYDETMKEHADSKTMPHMYWNHKSDEPIGDWLGWTTDASGLKMTGKLWVGQGIPKVQQAYNMLKSNTGKGLSIGYSVKKDGYSRDSKGVRHLTKLGLNEVSPVPMPMNRKAGILRVKSLDSITDSPLKIAFKSTDGKLITIREFEQILRDGGLSDTEAKTLLAGGYSKMTGRDGQEKSELLSMLKNLIPA